MNSWTRDVLDQILQTGNDLHIKSKNMSSNRCLDHMKPTQIYNYFFLGNLIISMRIGVDATSARISRDSTILQKIEDMLVEFFTQHPSGIVACVHSHFAIWKVEGRFFIFDPTEHNLEGGKWMGLPGMGYCYALRSNQAKTIADVVLKNCPLKQINRFTVYPCGLDKYVEVNTKPPQTLSDVQAVPLEAGKAVRKNVLSPKKHVKKISAPKPAEAEKPPETEAPATGAAPAEGQEAKTDPVEPKKSVSKSMIPPERPRLQSVTNFVELLPGRMGILRATTHQRDPKFTRYLGKQSVGNAIAAHTMLRHYRAKQWVRNVLDDVLRLGEHIHHDMKKLTPGYIPEKVTLYETDYSPKVEKYGAVGLIESGDDKILNLSQALNNALIDIDCCILNGPHIVAVWKQENKFYMFNPEERNPVGKLVEVGEAGVACLTWYTRLADLIAVYVGNLPKEKRNSRFMLCKVAIKDYVPRAEDWFNYKPLKINKWILRGTFNQNDRRFPRESRNSQCTANATMALTYKELKEEKDWDPQTMDEILVNGDELYRSCVQYLNEIGKFKHPHLMIDEIKTSFNVANKMIKLEVNDCLVNGVVNAKNDSWVPNLLKGFTEFFGENDAGVITANDLSMAVWKRDDVYYYFDSHSRDSRGIVTSYGTSCILRLMNLEDLANAMKVNLGTNKENLYNISRVVVKVFDITEEGVTMQPLNFYETLSQLVAILRSNTSQKDKKYDISAGKQQVPMCLAALAFNSVSPSLEWSKEDLDQVLNLGDKLYTDTMAANYAEGVPEELNVDDVTTANVYKKLNIGPNSIEIEIEENAFGNLEENLKTAMESLHERVNEQGHSAFQSIIESLYMTASMWRDDNLLYLFDPYPRDERGQVYGKDDWSAKVEIVEEGEGEYEGEAPPRR